MENEKEDSLLIYTAYFHNIRNILLLNNMFIVVFTNDAANSMGKIIIINV